MVHWVHALCYLNNFHLFCLAELAFVEFLSAQGIQSGVSVWQHTLVG